MSRVDRPAPQPAAAPPVRSAKPPVTAGDVIAFTLYAVCAVVMVLVIAKMAG
jgi:hypothetical protein